MNKIFCIIIIFFIFTFSARSSEIIQGSMDCKVTDQQITRIEDGIVKKFVGYSDGYQINDKFTFRYEIALKKKQEFKHFVLGFGHVPIVSKGRSDGIHIAAYSSFSPQKIIMSDYQGYRAVIHDKISGIFRFSPNEISVSQTIGSTLEMKRYFKNDWSGIIFKNALNDDPSVHYVTFNCTNINDKIDSIFSRLKDLSQ